MKLPGTFSVKEILKFCVGGGTAVLTDLALYYLLTGLGADVKLSKAVSYVAGAAAGFVINKLWTFSSKKFSAAEIMKYIALYAVSAAANAFVNSAALRFIGIKIVAFLAATGTSTVINFLGQKFFVFAKKEE